MKLAQTRLTNIKVRLKLAGHLAIAALAAAAGRPFIRRIKKAAAWADTAEEEIDRLEFDCGTAAEIRTFTNPGPEFEELDADIAKQHAPRAKAIAFYLPQFHEIPENNEWWGKGFTEWRNVARASPRFRGHYQPRIPRDLGFYALDDSNTLRRQVEYAKAGGLYGFCFYYYLFGAKRLLHAPVDLFRNNDDINFNFCLMWANDNWTRRWDGQDRDILIGQDYENHDDSAFVDDLQRHFQDSRYIRIDNRPLFFIYRPDLIDGLRERISRWRKLFSTKYQENPLFFMAQTGTLDPAAFGMEGAIEFPPHKILRGQRTLASKLSLLDQGFQGKVYSYDDLMKAAIQEPTQNFPLIKTVFPSWDNDARRQGAGTLVHGSTPDKYKAWLNHCVNYALENKVFGESFVGINAWNEWAEGAYLEPDVYYGAAYLNATARALCGNQKQSATERSSDLVFAEEETLAR